MSTDSATLTAPSGGNVLIYLLDRGAPAAHALRTRGYLTPEETARRDRFVRHEDRDRFTLGRAMLRAALGQALHRPPSGIAFALEEFGRPWLADAPALGFSLSHSGDYLAVAVSEFGRSVGVDVEMLERSIELIEIGATVFAPEEQARLLALPPPARETYFLTLWTLKEAYCKAIGLGLQFDPRDCVIEAKAPYRGIRFAEAPVTEVAQWRFAHWRLGERASLALAVRGHPDPRISVLPADVLAAPA